MRHDSSGRGPNKWPFLISSNDLFIKLKTMSESKNAKKPIGKENLRSISIHSIGHIWFVAYLLVQVFFLKMP